MRTASKLGMALDMAEGFVDLSIALARLARRRAKPQPRRGRGATVRPGADTPLWLALVARVRPHLRAYGAKARLARELDLDPSRVSQFFVTRTAQPDAERTLLLLLWFGRQGPPLLNKQALAEAVLTFPAGRGRRRSARSRRAPRSP